MPFHVDLLQIVNTELDGPGMHWILASSCNCPPSDINVYGSVNATYISEPVQAALAKLCDVPSKILSVRFKHTDSQLNSSDYRVMAIAIMVAIAHGIDPSYIEYHDNSEMMQHLLICMADRRFTPLPHSAHTQDDSLLSSHHIELYCTCKMPDSNHLYFECERCEEWYHRQCERHRHFSKNQVEKATLYCRSCDKDGPS